MSKSTKKYTKEFKQEAVNLALKSPSIEVTARELGFPASTLHGWIHALKKRGNILTNGANTNQDIPTLIEENRRLHRELAIAKEEKEILKKAATYFAQHRSKVRSSK